MKGILHTMVAAPSEERINKYKKRMLIFEKKQIQQVHKGVQRQQEKQNTLVVVEDGGVYNTYVQSATGQIQDIEHRHLEPSNVISTAPSSSSHTLTSNSLTAEEQAERAAAIESEAIDLHEKKTIHQQNNEKLTVDAQIAADDEEEEDIEMEDGTLATEQEIEIELERLKEENKLASSNVQWVHFSMFSGVGISTHALHATLNNKNKNQIATYYFETDQDNRDIIQHHIISKQDQNEMKNETKDDCDASMYNKIFDDPLILSKNKFVTLLALIKHHSSNTWNTDIKILVTAGGRPLSNFHKIDPTYYKPKIYVSGFDKLKMNEQRLEELFKKCGTVESVRIARNVNNQSRGFGFVLFSELDTEDDGTTQNSMHDQDEKMTRARRIHKQVEAAESMTGEIVDGKKIRVKPAKQWFNKKQSRSFYLIPQMIAILQQQVNAIGKNQKMSLKHHSMATSARVFYIVKQVGSIQKEQEIFLEKIYGKYLHFLFLLPLFKPVTSVALSLPRFSSILKHPNKSFFNPIKYI